MQINLGLTPSANNSAIASIYAVWSFVHLIFRVYVVSLAGSRVHDWAHKIVELFRLCPNEAYITEVQFLNLIIIIKFFTIAGNFFFL